MTQNDGKNDLKLTKNLCKIITSDVNMYRSKTIPTCVAKSIVKQDLPIISLPLKLFYRHPKLRFKTVPEPNPSLGRIYLSNQ